MNFSRIRETWTSLDTRSQVTLVGGLLAVLVTLYVLYGYATKQSYSTLVTNLDPAQTGQDEATLASAGVAYKISAGGTEIDIPASSMAQARVALAQKGQLG